MQSIRNFFKSNKPALADIWQIPETTDDLLHLFGPDSGLNVIYKHSFSCGFSVVSKNRIEPVLEKYKRKASFYFIDVKGSRHLSNAVAEQTGIRHESPQLIVLRDGEVVGHTSHGGVSKEFMEDIFLEEI